MIGNQITDFLHYIKFEKRYSQHTQISYSKDLSQFFSYISEQFGIDDISTVSHFHVRSWLAAVKDDGATATTVNHKLSSLKSFFKYLMKHGFVSKNPVKQLHSLKQPERLPSYLKETETETLQEEVHFEEGFKGFTDKLLCDLLYQTGMRRSEVINLGEKNIEWRLGQLRVLGKGNKERLVPISPALSDTLKLYIEEKKSLGIDDGNHLLCLENGQPLYGGYVYRVVNKYLNETKQGGHPITTISKKSPHTMRHTFATHLLNNGANIQAIKDLLGHSSLAATQVYTHNNIDKLKEIHKTNHPRG
ncbi:MAG: tyrosine-type recombinase/integrase [Bacteroidetes bacterium]|nr:tyrosine-type recombinase/integrase [Bacteroidota bacterium]